MASIGFDIPTTSSHANATIAFQATDSSGNGDLQFWLEDDNTSRERLRILSGGAVLIGETSQSSTQPGDLIVHASVQSGNVNEPAVIYRSSSGDIIYFEHYFNCIKGGSGNSHVVNQDIITVSGLGNFHQAVFHAWFGVRLQGQGDSYTRPATWQTGVNRFNGGSSIQFEENWISADSAIQTLSLIHI